MIELEVSLQVEKLILIYENQIELRQKYFQSKNSNWNGFKCLYHKKEEMAGAVMQYTKF